MRRLIFLLEEPSAEEMLRGVLPRILPEDCYPEFKVFEGKQDLERGLTRVLKAWRTPDCSFVVLRDQDSGDCRRVKHKLVDLCSQAGRGDLPMLSVSPVANWKVFISAICRPWRKGLVFPAWQGSKTLGSFGNLTGSAAPRVSLSG